MGTVNGSRDAVVDEAIAWHLALDDAGADEWRQFVAWLEADPAHAEAYDRLTLDDDALSPDLIEVAFPPPAPPAPRRRAWLRYGGVGGGIVAAAAAAWLTLLPATAPSSAPYVIETQPGVHRSVKLADGSRVEMNGNTRIALDRAQPRRATLERGEAIFRVVHHPDQPFELRSGAVTLRDVGTVFNVIRAGPRFRVAVAEGAVLYQPEQDAVPLKQGMVLVAHEGENRVTISHVDTDSVGGWSHGHLDFRNTTLDVVAEDVARSIGTPVAVAPALAGQYFTGTLRLNRPPDEVLRSLASLADASLQRDGPGWMIAPRAGGAR